ncbi:MAG: thioredoxin family protein [Candidatus Accumulibacter phosphatis]|mgnify:CR=1 FL=1|jgi:thioredoxin 1|uniref:thioredoxin family protein n=1 Tax=Candidatus Accumulibacter sp. ACC012 TaxID=2823332 RepID=UPI0025BBE5FD|nr:thioredoxin family protein [Candidatus Accumulibacter sp. ACC012]
MKASPIPSGSEPSRIEIDALEVPAIVEFGASWCGYCRAAEPLIAQVLANHPQLAHIKIEDGPGRSLGRSFRVKLWPTLVFMHRGKEVARLVRPGDAREIERTLAQFPATV